MFEKSINLMELLEQRATSEPNKIIYHFSDTGDAKDNIFNL